MFGTVTHKCNDILHKLHMVRDIHRGNSFESYCEEECPGVLVVKPWHMRNRPGREKGKGVKVQRTVEFSFAIKWSCDKNAEPFTFVIYRKTRWTALFYNTFLHDFSRKINERSRRRISNRAWQKFGCITNIHAGLWAIGRSSLNFKSWVRLFF